MADTLFSDGSTIKGFFEKTFTSLLDTYGQGAVVIAGSFLIHEFVFFGRYLPFYICDFIPFLRKYKLQADKENTPEQIWKCLRGIFFSHFVVQLPLMMSFHPFVEWLGMTINGSFPTIETMAWQVFFCMVVEDFWEYWFHRFLHWGPLYKHIHKIHHEFSSPFGITAEYAHWAETLILGTGTLLGPAILAQVTGLHLITLWAWLVARLFQTVDAHSGYDFPWSLHHWVPFWAGAEFHDHHHMAFMGNYASSFRWCDWMFGTDTKYRAFREKKLQEETQKTKVIFKKSD